MNDGRDDLSHPLPHGVDRDGLAADLLTELRLMPAIDCHEHLRFGHMHDWATMTESTLPYTGSLSALLLAPYVLSHLPAQVQSGRFWEPMELDSHALRQAVVDALPRIAREEPSIYRANLAIPFGDLYAYDIDTLSLDDWGRLDQQVRQRYHAGPWRWHDRLCQRLCVQRAVKISVAPDYYDQWLKTLQPADRDLEQQLFACTLNVDLFIRSRPRTGASTDATFERWAHELGAKLDTFGDYRELVRRVFDTFRQTPAVGLKTGMAGYRRFDDPPVAPGPGSGLYVASWLDDAVRRHWQSMMFGIVAAEAGRIGLPLGIHAGFDGQDPKGLEPVIAQPDSAATTFVIIHAGYPHHRDTAELARRHENVHVDLTWIPVRDFVGAVDAYEHLLTAVAPTRLTIGADAHYPETFYGMWVVHLEALATALARLMRGQAWSRKRALDLARRILYDNAVRLYGLAAPRGRGG